MIRILLLVQGLYYIATALWALFALEHFARNTGLHFGPMDDVDRFEMISIAAMALVLGIFLIYGGLKSNLRKIFSLLAIGLAAAIIIPEVIFLPRIGNPVLFWLDFLEELGIATLLGAALLRGK